MRLDNDREMIINREREGNMESQIEREKERSERVVEREKEEKVRDKENGNRGDNCNKLQPLLSQKILKNFKILKKS